LFSGIVVLAWADPRMTDPAEQLYLRVLVLRAQAGDEAAFAELAGRYEGRLRYYLRKMLGNAHTAEDALQDVWLDVWRGLSRLAEPAAFTAWMYRIARDRACRVLRRLPRDRPLDEADVPDEATEESFSVADAEAIHRALDELAPEHREVLVLRFLEEMSYEDIARVAGCQLGTVRSRLHYAKRALRRALEARCDRE
jgi:RNA polymerase sigma-70 factor (ECF subfamily)